MAKTDVQQCNVIPLGNRVLVRPDFREMTAGGIALPDATKDQCRRGVVVRLGTGSLNKEGGPAGFERMYFPFPPSLVVGAVVLYGRYASSDTKGVDELKGHILVDVDSILGVVPQE